MASSSNPSPYIIAWLDENVAKPDCCQQLKEAFTTTINPNHRLPTTIGQQDISNLIRDSETSRQISFYEVPCTINFFDDMDKCYKFLLAYAGKKRIFFMTSGRLGQYIVPKLLTKDPHVFHDKNGKLYEPAIYIFCADMAQHAQWAYDFLELNCIEMYKDEKLILSHLTRDIANYLLSEGEQLLVKNQISLIETAHQYFTWARKLHLQAESVWKGGLTPDLLSKIDELIGKAGQKIQQLKSSTDPNDDEMTLSEEN